jgi:hypothetical protein
MRRLRKGAARLAALVPPAVLGVTAVVAGGGGAKGEARGLLGVTVEVVVPCAASLSGAVVAVDAGCSALGGPMAVREEAAPPAPAEGAVQGPMTATVENAADTRYITVLY